MNSFSSSKPHGVTGRLCTWIHDVEFASFPREVVERAKYLILDGIACALVGAHLPWSETASKAIFKMEPAGPCTVIGWGHRRLSPLSAALLNSTYTQGFELDDYHSTAPLHSNALLIPALLAAVESGDGIRALSGADFLRAYIIGCEVGPRVGLALHGMDLLSRGWHSGAVQGPSASASAVSALLRLSHPQIESALGIACTQACGLMSAQYGSMAKRMQHGFGSRNGLFAALMAREDYTGIQAVYETSYGGFLSCFSQGANFEPKALPDELVRGLGSRWELNEIRVKLHAAMAGLHGTIDCIERLQQAHVDLFKTSNLRHIERIETRHARAIYEHGGWIAPVDEPITSTAAQMSVQYAAAAQLVDREVLVAQYSASRLNRPLLRELMAKIHPIHDESLDADAHSRWITITTVRFEDGQEVQEQVAAPKGIAPPVSNEGILDKWRRLTAVVLDDERRAGIEKSVLSLETLEDAKALAGLLQAEVACPIDDSLDP